ncbi:hypothetical protein FPV67DRAFT_1452682 [Lyophyllum atratum]|nr:hypothetical protein FPV67DRAFT_1452682 [Lyophyllum atratum]
MSGSTPPADVAQAYFDSLARKQIALSQLVEEVPSSRCGSPFQDGDGSEQSRSKLRVDALRIKVQEAFKYANGDPADGKWSLVVQLLQLNTTRRRRWLGSTTAGEKAESSSGWINARSQKEWEEWEAKWTQEMLLKRKVQSWQEKVDKHLVVASVPIVSISQDVDPAKGTAEKKLPSQGEVANVKRTATLQSVSKSSSTLSFPVVKRSSITVIGKPKPSGNPSASDSIAGPSKLQPGSSSRGARGPDAPIDSDSPATKPQRPIIEDISETSFLPPSFPSQLQTSTPNAKTDRRHKPEPIILVPPSSPLSTPPSTRVYGRQQPHPEPSSSLPEPPSTPTRHLEPDSTPPRIQAREKRARSITPQHAVKKARIASALASSSSDGPAPPSTPPPLPLPQAAHTTHLVTPKRAQMPTLTELLASSKSPNKAKFSPRKTKQLAPATTSSAPTPPPPQHKLVEPLPQPAQEQRPVPEVVLAHKVQLNNPEPPSIFDEPDLEPDIYQRLSYNMGIEPGMAPEYDYDMGSPTKSLSSLAASDSDEEEEQALDHVMGTDLNMDDSFDPPFASTQAGGRMGYNSQFDVDGRVDIVSKFMEKDVDFDGWLRDPSLGPEGIESQ